MAAARKSTSRFKVGDEVRVDARAALGHCRTPWYIRGKSGVVSKLQGIFHDPSRLAYHKPGLPLIPLYKIRFRQVEVWPSYTGDPGDHIEVDLQEDWLASPDGGRK